MSLGALLLTTTAYSQSITISPTSLQFWGTVPQTMKVSAEFKNFELVGLYGFRRMHDSQGDPAPPSSGLKRVGDGIYEGFYFALFYKPLNFIYQDFRFWGGAGIFNKRFPTKHGQRVAFTAQLSYQFSERFSIRYSHISNGLGITNELNPGVDNLGIKINLFEPM